MAKLERRELQRHLLERLKDLQTASLWSSMSPVKLSYHRAEYDEVMGLLRQLGKTPKPRRLAPTEAKRPDQLDDESTLAELLRERLAA